VRNFGAVVRTGSCTLAVLQGCTWASDSKHTISVMVLLARKKITWCSRHLNSLLWCHSKLQKCHWPIDALSKQIQSGAGIMQQ
jgi:hypothetical protein